MNDEENRYEEGELVGDTGLTEEELFLIFMENYE